MKDEKVSGKVDYVSKHTPGDAETELVFAIVELGVKAKEYAQYDDDASFAHLTDAAVSYAAKAKPEYAAAPDLLEAAKAMLAWTEREDAVPLELDDALRAAIAKAEGAR